MAAFSLSSTPLNDKPCSRKVKGCTLASFAVEVCKGKGGGKTAKLRSEQEVEIRNGMLPRYVSLWVAEQLVREVMDVALFAPKRCCTKTRQ